jgi:GT2 family glycosyltransferase
VHDISFENSEKPRVGIIITSYNHIDYTERALESFYLSVNEKIDCELWLLDDCSTENIEGVYNKYKDVGLKFYKNSTNTGLTSLWNKGFQLNKGKEYLIICNNDVIFSNHWADNLICSLRNTHMFSVAIPVTNAPGHVPAQFVANFVRNYIPSDNKNKINSIAAKLKDKAPQKIEKANGFCMAIKVSLLSSNLINGVPFNENCPIYGGENELFLRVKPQIMVVPSSFIFHYKQVSVDRKNYPDQIFRPEHNTSTNICRRYKHCFYNNIRWFYSKYVKKTGDILVLFFDL